MRFVVFSVRAMFLTHVSSRREILSPHVRIAVLQLSLTFIVTRANPNSNDAGVYEFDAELLDAFTPSCQALLEHNAHTHTIHDALDSAAATIVLRRLDQPLHPDPTASYVQGPQSVLGAHGKGMLGPAND